MDRVSYIMLINFSGRTAICAIAGIVLSSVSLVLQILRHPSFKNTSTLTRGVCLWCEKPINNHDRRLAILEPSRLAHSVPELIDLLAIGFCWEQENGGDNGSVERGEPSDRSLCTYIRGNTLHSILRAWALALIARKHGRVHEKVSFLHFYRDQ